MVRLALEMITKLGPGQNKRRPDETVPHYMSRLTHIYLQDKQIDGIDPMPVYKNLTVLYLYDNVISQIENLEFCPNLTHLYLQNNRIKRLENLGHLTQLTKLHIGGNSIKVVEGLENLTELVELQIENQRLPPGEQLMFDPRTLMSLIKNLQILNISGNSLDTLNEIEPLSNLIELNAGNNNLRDMKELSTLLKYCFRLRKLELIGNPLCAKNKYRERIIVQAPNIEIFDGKEIQDVERQFLQNWKESKELTNQHRIKQETQASNDVLPQANIFNSNSNYYDVAELPKMLNPAMPTYIMPDYKKKQFSSNSFKSKFPKFSSTSNVNALDSTNNFTASSNGMDGMAKHSNAFSKNRFASSTMRTRNVLMDNEIKYKTSKSAVVGNKFVMSDANNYSTYMP